MFAAISPPSNRKNAIFAAPDFRWLCHSPRSNTCCPTDQAKQLALKLCSSPTYRLYIQFACNIRLYNLDVIRLSVQFPVLSFPCLDTSLQYKTRCLYQVTYSSASRKSFTTHQITTLSFLHSGLVICSVEQS